MKKRIIESFSKATLTYDNAAIVQKQIAKELAQRIPKTSAKTILELGAGTGIFSQELIASYPEASLLLTDISPKMVEACQQRFNKIPHVQFACLDAEEITLPNSYDLIFSCMALHWLSEFENSFKQIISKLTLGGQFVFSLLGEGSLQEWRNIWQKFSFPYPTPRFCSYQNLKSYFPNMSIERKTIKQHYNNSYDFLTSLKHLGAIGTEENYIALSAGKLRKILREFNSSIDISYEVIYGKYVND